MCSWIFISEILKRATVFLVKKWVFRSENAKWIFFFRYSVVDLKRPISVDAEKPSMILVLLKHTPNLSSQFIDLDIEIPFFRGTFG
jgi:hypothetical protein